MTSRYRIFWKPEDWQRCKRMREADASHQEIADALNCTVHRIAMKFANEKTRQRFESRGAVTRLEPSPAARLELERALRAQRSLTEQLCGDPLPGRSALDKKRTAPQQPTENGNAV